MKAARIVILLLLLGLAFLLGWKAAGRRVQIIEKSTVDTVTLYVDRNPEPSDVSDPVKEVEDTLPVVPPTKPEPAEPPVMNQPPPADSATVRVPLSLYHFEKPGVYSITALGYHVSLPKVETFSIHTTTVQTQIVRELPAWEIGLEVGINPRNKWLGATASYNIGRFSLQASGGYDPYRREVLVEGRVKVALFRTYHK